MVEPLEWLLFLPLVVSLIFQSGCCTKPYRNADVLIPDAHGGGHSLAINPDSTQLAAGSWSGGIRLWRLPNGEDQYSWQAHRGDVTGLSYINNDRLLSAGYDGQLTEWRDRGQGVRNVQTGSPVTAMAVDPVGQLVLTGHADGWLRLWSVTNLSPIKVLGRHAGSIRAVAVAPEGGSFASSAWDGRVKIWKDDGNVTDLPKAGSDARALVYSHQGRHLYGAGWFNLFRWDLQQRRLMTLDTDHGGIINSIVLDPWGRYLASISRQTDSSVLIIDPRSGTTIHRFQPHKLCGGAVVISPDGRIMASTSDDASVMIWHLHSANLKPIRNYEESRE